MLTGLKPEKGWNTPNPRIWRQNSEAFVSFLPFLSSSPTLCQFPSLNFSFSPFASSSSLKLFLHHFAIDALFSFFFSFSVFFNLFSCFYRRFFLLERRSLETFKWHQGGNQFACRLCRSQGATSLTL